MINYSKIQFNPKECKYYLDAYDVIFVDDQRELRFCRYCKSKDASISGKYHMVVKDNNQIFDYITRDRALCYFDDDHHRWCSKVDDHRYKCWQVIRPDDDIFINVLVGIAIDEISGSKTDLSVDDLTHRIKSRFGIWYDGYIHKSYLVSNKTIKIPDSIGIKIPDVSTQNTKNYVAYKLPQPKFIQFNGDYTTVVWKDGSHTVVKLGKGEEYDEEKAILYATIKRMNKNNGCATQRYLGQFYDHVKGVNKED